MLILRVSDRFVFVDISSAMEIPVQWRYERILPCLSKEYNDDQTVSNTSNIIFEFNFQWFWVYFSGVCQENGRTVGEDKGRCTNNAFQSNYGNSYLRSLLFVQLSNYAIAPCGITPPL